MKRYTLLDEMEDGYWTQKGLCDLTGRSRSGVQRALSELVKEGLVSIARQRRPAVYTRSDKALTEAQKVRKELVKIKVPRSPTAGGNGMLTRHLFQHSYAGRVKIVQRYLLQAGSRSA